MKFKTITQVVFLFISFSFAQAQKYTVDLSKSKLEWRSTKFNGAHNGQVKIQSGFIYITKGRISGGEFVIDMKSITVLDTDDKGKQKDIVDDISGKTFYNVKEFSTAKFTISEYSNNMLKGDLTIKGNKVSIQFKVFSKINDKTLVAIAPLFEIDRRKWKLKLSNWIKESAVNNELEFKVHIEATNR